MGANSVGIASSKLSLKRIILLQDSNGHFPSGERKTAMLTVTFSASFRSSRFGQPEPELATQLAKMRYPTLQRLAHTLPKDPKYRAHVVRSIRVAGT